MDPLIAWLVVIGLLVTAVVLWIVVRPRGTRKSKGLTGVFTPDKDMDR